MLEDVENLSTEFLWTPEMQSALQIPSLLVHVLQLGFYTLMGPLSVTSQRFRLLNQLLAELS